MTKINWLGLLEKNEEKIIDALRQAYRQAIGGESSWQECVDINRDGKITVYTIGSNSTDGEVWNGDALEVARFAWWEPDVDGEDVVNFLKNEDKLGEFTRWLMDGEHIEPEDMEDESELWSKVWLLEEWNPELWKQYMEEYTDWIIEDFDPDHYFREAVEGQKLREEMQG